MAPQVVPLCRRSFPHSSPTWLLFFRNLGGDRGMLKATAGPGARWRGEQGGEREAPMKAVPVYCASLSLSVL